MGSGLNGTSLRLSPFEMALLRITILNVAPKLLPLKKGGGEGFVYICFGSYQNFYTNPSQPPFFKGEES